MWLLRRNIKLRFGIKPTDIISVYHLIVYSVFNVSTRVLLYNANRVPVYRKHSLYKRPLSLHCCLIIILVLSPVFTNFYERLWAFGSACQRSPTNTNFCQRSPTFAQTSINAGPNAAVWIQWPLLAWNGRWLSVDEQNREVIDLSNNYVHSGFKEWKIVYERKWSI
jgi:hypothetical protein